MNKLIVCNMKMNLDKQEIDSYLGKIKNIDLSNVIFCPTSIYLPYFIKNNLNVGIQNISRYESGSHTGQISIKQISSMNIKYAIIGHSETNNDLKEIHEKVQLCSKFNITPIICIGEKEKLSIDETKKVLEEQLSTILNNTKLDRVIVAYEPVWMIGSGENFDTNTLHSIVKFIKKIVKNYQINDIIILYGGSVNKNNIKNILENVDGVLLGNASIDVNHFLEILEVA